MTIYAYHTDDGAPMNETALCEEHAHGEYLDFATGMLAGADDAPAEPEFHEVEHPENNDTVCVECGAPS